MDLDSSRIKGLRSELRRNKKRIRRLNTSLQGLQVESQQQRSALSYIERAWSQVRAFAFAICQAGECNWETDAVLFGYRQQLQFELEQLLGSSKAEAENEPSTGAYL